MGKKISFTSSDTKIASEALDRLSKLYGNCAIEDADVIVALGGMVSCCKRFTELKIYRLQFMV